METERCCGWSPPGIEHSSRTTTPQIITRYIFASNLRRNQVVSRTGSRLHQTEVGYINFLFYVLSHSTHSLNIPEPINFDLINTDKPNEAQQLVIQIIYMAMARRNRRSRAPASIS